MQILIRTNDETKKILQKEAGNIGITLNALMLVIINDWIQGREKEQNVKK